MKLEVLLFLRKNSPSCESVKPDKFHAVEWCEGTGQEFPFQEGELPRGRKERRGSRSQASPKAARQIPFKSYSLRTIILWISNPTFVCMGQLLANNPTLVALLGRGHALKALPGERLTPKIWGSPTFEVLQ